MTADLTPTERAHVDRIEQEPDALGLREEVAEVLENVQDLLAGHGTYAGVDDYADALLPIIERREAEAAERALRDAADAWETDVTDPTPRTGSRADGWLRNRADQIGGTR